MRCLLYQLRALCVKVCPEGAIQLIDNTVGSISMIDYDKCTGCGTCVEKCPRKCIHLDPPIDPELVPCEKPAAIEGGELQLPDSRLLRNAGLGLWDKSERICKRKDFLSDITEKSSEGVFLPALLFFLSLLSLGSCGRESGEAVRFESTRS